MRQHGGGDAPHRAHTHHVRLCLAICLCLAQEPFDHVVHRHVGERGEQHLARPPVPARATQRALQEPEHRHEQMRLARAKDTVHEDHRRRRPGAATAAAAAATAAATAATAAKVGTQPVGEPKEYLMKQVIRDHPRSSEVIRGH